jgi:hypothetical protein
VEIGVRISGFSLSLCLRVLFSCIQIRPETGQYSVAVVNEEIKTRPDPIDTMHADLPGWL